MPRRSNPCPFCDFASPKRDALDQHVVELHMEPAYLSVPEYLKCWCGEDRLTTGRQSMRAHLREHGGAVAHYLACQLGTNDAAR